MEMSVLRVLGWRTDVLIAQDFIECLVPLLRLPLAPRENKVVADYAEGIVDICIEGGPMESCP